MAAGKLSASPNAFSLEVVTLMPEDADPPELRDGLRQEERSGCPPNQLNRR